MNVLSTFALTLFYLIQLVGSDRWDCGVNCIGGPANSPDASGLDNCALGCLGAAQSGAECDDTNCICDGIHFTAAISAISSCAVQSCTAFPQDPAAATAIAADWCSMWSKTASLALVTPYTAQTIVPTAAIAPTVATVTTTV